ncbi:MAG: DUF1015 domain-containing protein [Phaeodactylibacter sp.]|nr:DUF1015 domain-containing protein [Phaeodactylibacter sp.]
MHIKPFQALYPRMEFISSPDEFFGAIKEDFGGFNDHTLFHRPGRRSLFVYRITNAAGSFSGLLASVDIRDFLEGHIRKHEFTLEVKEQKQMELMLRRRAAIKPVLLAYHRAEVLSDWIARYTEGRAPTFEASFLEGQERHTFWEASSPADIEEAQRLFEAYVPTAYIADGHHRTASAARMHALAMQGKLPESFSQLFCAFFPSSDIEILAFNRVVEGLNGHTPGSLLVALSEYCEVEVMAKPEKPAHKHELSMLLDKKWYRLCWKPALLQLHAHEPAVLDASLLNEVVLQKILGLTDVRSCSRLSYVEGPKGLDGLCMHVEGCTECVAFCLYPIQLEEVILMADNARALPPKSTWFEPRMKNGLVMQLIED